MLVDSGYGSHTGLSREKSGLSRIPYPELTLTQGQRILEQLFPGLKDELTAAGAPTIAPKWVLFLC